MHQNKILTLAPDVTWKQFEDEALLVHLDTGEIYQINPTAIQVVRLLQQGTSLDQILTTLTNEYQAEKAEIEQKVLAFLNDCLQYKLLVEQNGTK